MKYFCKCTKSRRTDCVSDLTDLRHSVQGRWSTYVKVVEKLELRWLLGSSHDGVGQLSGACAALCPVTTHYCTECSGFQRFLTHDFQLTICVCAVDAACNTEMNIELLSFIIVITKYMIQCHKCTNLMVSNRTTEVVFHLFMNTSSVLWWIQFNNVADSLQLSQCCNWWHMPVCHI